MPDELKTINILVVDDSPTIVALHRSIMKNAGDRILVAENGQAAWDRLQSQAVDLLLTDIEMPKMNGMEVCRKVKKELGLDEVFIVLLTAKGQELDRQKGQEVGADVYMTKPFDPEIILSKAREVLDLQ